MVGYCILIGSDLNIKGFREVFGKIDGVFIFFSKVKFFYNGVGKIIYYV